MTDTKSMKLSEWLKAKREEMPVRSLSDLARMTEDEHGIVIDANYVGFVLGMPGHSEPSNFSDPTVGATPAKEPLTVDKLKRLKYRLKMHLNGRNWSGMVRENEEYGLVYSYRTNGSPRYEYTSRTIMLAGDETVVADLLSSDFNGELQRFVDAYNAKRG